MKKRVALIALAACLVNIFSVALAAEATGFSLETLGMTTAFPEGWTVVTPDSVARHMGYFAEETPEIAAEVLRAEGVEAIAFSPEGDATLSVIATQGDADVALYYDIERYTSAMRTAIKEDFLDREAWALTGYRYSAANWTNKEAQGRVLNLSYTVRAGEETIARGRQAYTIRNGRAITLDLQVTGRQITSADERVFAAFLAATTFPESRGMPLLPVGLTFTGVVPEETYTAAVTVRGESTKDARVSAWLVHDDNSLSLVGEVTAGSGGVFKLEMVLPEQGEMRLYFKAELDGFATSEEARWIHYDKRQIPVTFTSYPEGVYTESQVVISGKTISGVTIQCMEGEVNRKVTTGSDGAFSIKMDRAIIGDRTIVLSLTKKDFDNRRFEIVFDRQWSREDHVKYLSGQVQSLSYANLTGNPEKYVGRIVKYSGEVLDISTAGDIAYIQLGLKQDKEGAWTERIIAVATGMAVPFAEGERAVLYTEITGEAYGFSDVTADGDEVSIDLPAVKLLTYE